MFASTGHLYQLISATSFGFQPLAGHHIRHGRSRQGRGFDIAQAIPETSSRRSTAHEFL